MEGPGAEMAEEVDKMRQQRRSIPELMQDLHDVEFTDGPPLSSDQLELLRGVREFLDDQMDADDGVPNEAMRLLVELDRVFPEAKNG